MASALTAAQLALLKADIQAQVAAATAGFPSIGSTGAIADWYNVASTTLAWGETVSAKSLDEGADYSAFDSIAAGKRDAWALFLQYAPRDMSKGRNRKVVTDVWGSATANSTAEAILQASTVKATRGELVLSPSAAAAATGTVSAIKRTFVGFITNDDVITALA